MKPNLISKMISVVAIMCWIAFFISSCKKAKNNNPSHTSKMGGVRHWRVYQYHNYGGGDDTTYINLDTSFAITIVDGNTINCLSQVFTYKSSVSTDSTSVFYGPYVSTSVAWYASYVLDYDIYSDRIIYFYESSVLGHFDYCNYYSQ